MPFIVRKKDVAEKLEEVYRKYRVWLDYLYRLYAQGVPVVVPSTTSIPIQIVPSTIPDPASPSQYPQIVSSTTSIPEEEGR